MIEQRPAVHVNGTSVAEQQSPHIVVRHAEPTDTAALHRIFREASVVYGTFELPYAPLASASRFTTDLAEGRYTLVACTGDQIVGTLGISPVPYSGPRVRHAARLGPIATASEWQGRGVGSALMAAAIDLADRWLNLVRLELQVWVDNALAIALYRKFGFVEEGVHRALGFRDGAYVDLITMARVRGDHR